MRQSPEIPKDKLIVTPKEAAGRVDREECSNGLVKEIKFGKDGEPESFSVFDENGETIVYLNLDACHDFINAHNMPEQIALLRDLEQQVETVLNLHAAKRTHLGKMAQA